MTFYQAWELHWKVLKGWRELQSITHSLPPENFKQNFLLTSSPCFKGPKQFHYWALPSSDLCHIKSKRLLENNSTFGESDSNDNFYWSQSWWPKVWNQTVPIPDNFTTRQFPFMVSFVCSVKNKPTITRVCILLPLKQVYAQDKGLNFLDSIVCSVWKGSA